MDKEYHQIYYMTNWRRLKVCYKKRYEKINKFINDYKLSKGCAICGYNKCASALDFHHPNNDKEFNVSIGKTSKSIEKIKQEMNKCTVICSNCHRELREGKNE